MLKREFRLSNFSLTNAKQISLPLFNIKMASNNLEKNRFSFVVSKKVDGRATKRNLLKRKVRAGFEILFDRISVGHDFIVYPKKENLEVSQDVIQKEVESFLTKQKLI